MLTFIGIGSAFNTELGNTSAWLRQGNHLVLLDCGGSVFERILKQKLLEGIAILDICLTHTHGDHVGSLGDLVLYCHYILDMKPTLRHPEAERIRTLMTLLGVPGELYILEDSMAFSLEDWLDARFVQQEHVDTMTAYGLLLKRKQQSCWYSGDSKEIPSEILEDFLREKISLMYQDTSGIEISGKFHMNLSQLKDLIPETHRNRVICMHQDEAFNRETAVNLGFRIAEIGGEPVNNKK